MTAAELIADYRAYCLLHDIKFNATRTRDTVNAAYAIAEAHGQTVHRSPFYGDDCNLAWWMSVECMSTTCKSPAGTLFDGDEWNRDHIHNDGHGVAGDELSKAIRNGYDAHNLQFLCSNCNQAKRRTAKAVLHSDHVLV